jgi:hypothetical protein
MEGYLALHCLLTWIFFDLLLLLPIQKFLVLLLIP